jgi:formylglycine-generating enzyme required for sulfatase activity
MKNQKFFIILSFFILFSSILCANNIKIDSTWIVERNTTEHYFTIGFTLSWENSFRDSTNYDAAYVFMKYRKDVSGDTFFHSTLDTLDANHQIWSANSMTIDASFEKDNLGTGVMIYRTDTANTDIACDSVYLRWYYNRGETMTDANLCTGLRVFGIEMVYIPESKFFVGDGSSDNHFYRYNKISSPPYQLLSEDSIIIGTNEGELWAGKYITACTLPTAFPKGYAPFYIMRYEITQGQYRDFLMSLDSASAVNRYPNHYGSARYYIRHIGNVYGCDANNNAVFDEPDDGEWIGCGWLEYQWGFAYLDWAGLRPMTELEFEKGCRGPKYSVVNEYAWGDASLTKGSLEFACTDSERVIPANTNFCDAYPYRVGACAEPTGNRIESGASYYGVMDLSSSLTERCIILYNGYAPSTSYTGNHGDGVLGTSPGWPRSGIRGGYYYDNPHYVQYWQVSSRHLCNSSITSYKWGSGFRGVRSP